MSTPPFRPELGRDASRGPANNFDRRSIAAKGGKAELLYHDDSISDNFRDSLDSHVEPYQEVADGGRGGRRTVYLPVRGQQRYASRSPAPPRTLDGIWSAFWASNRGLVLVMLSQFFGAIMNATARLLETNGEGMDPLQILFVRMSITTIICGIYMWYDRAPHFPFGKREVRALLVARGIGGFFGVAGMYYSLLYLPVSEATVITFLAPILACWACSVFINEPFTRKEQLAGLVSLLGVFLIARPIGFLHFSHSPSVAIGSTDAVSDSNVNATSSTPKTMPHDLSLVTPMQRLMAVGMSLIGVLGAACAYTTIRWIGKRAHPLISVTYFSTWCTLVSFFGLLVVPGLSFRLPASILQWSYLILLGICGFIMQFLLTAGLSHERSSRATNMVYTQMLFALSLDKLIWGTQPGGWSIAGSGLILGAAIYVAVKRDGAKGEGERNMIATEGERALVDRIHAEGGDVDDISEDPDGRRPLRDVEEMPLRPLRI